MKNNWETKKIGEITEICLGLTHTPNYKESGIPFLSVTNITGDKIDFTRTKFISKEEFESMPYGSKPKKGDVLFCRVGTIGSPKILESNVQFGIFVSLGFFRPNTELVFNKYLYYWMLSSSFETQVYKNVQGGVLKNLNTGWLKNFEILLPPLNIQKEIVTKLDEKFAKLKEAKKLQEEALVDTGKILSQTLREIFEEGKQKGWEEEMIKNIANVGPVKSEIKDLTDDSLISFIPMSSVDELSQAIEKQEERKLGEVRNGYTYFKRGDIILAKVTPCMENGKIAITDNLKTEVGFGSSEFHIIRANPKILNSKYLYQILRQKDFREIAKEKMTGTSGLKRVPKDFIENYKIFLPSLSEQQKIVTRLDKLSEKVKALRGLQTSQLEDIKRLEKAYLREAFNGELF